MTALDRISMAEWMNARGLSSPRLRWWVNYACRDDYGMELEQTSAWAGLFYFCSRVVEPGIESQSLITWPEGNGRLVQHLFEKAKANIQLDRAAVELIPVQDGVDVITLDREGRNPRGFHARRVIFAAPQQYVVLCHCSFRQLRIAVGDSTPSNAIANVIPCTTCVLKLVLSGGTQTLNTGSPTATQCPQPGVGATGTAIGQIVSCYQFAPNSPKAGLPLALNEGPWTRRTVAPITVSASGGKLQPGGCTGHAVTPVTITQYVWSTSRSPRSCSGTRAQEPLWWRKRGLRLRGLRERQYGRHLSEELLVYSRADRGHWVRQEPHRVHRVERHQRQGRQRRPPDHPPAEG